LRDRFFSLWRKYFGNARLPITIFFSDESPQEAAAATKSGECIVTALPLVDEGKALCYSAESRICGGAKRYLGFTAGVETAVDKITQELRAAGLLP
jgi:hypothetical protein